MSNENNQSFEDMMTELEGIVQKLDNENVSLEDSLSLYQRGMTLSAKCDETLKDAEQKVNDLMSNEKDVAENESKDE
ncbi:exodeoxyribonuclease VII small subunit [Staphylococcus gallinarum]|jgi:exodeoxyribonuclease VII small subunit|uniref:Exodeoxyribonuclease 7 small subunit n=1 Tax=Staphylococcus gallinarum TaxID=1293 RepID=A0A2T4SYQ5_STAGA|nr:exodeoxyribonuclease VII small subunit [Staphylococcus gallinarum]MBU7216147.1 exodeoxyribonuclease VII small subunit [Staphylococcus gallinarum]MCD8786271.1 exodeoxyribonuclease VII small subunit [Staphylococcus gallinarum]MCD8792866.1 exodeoxyribonuclease VII small subunit [Staphylococcus gallinarum]MCD8820097.1 exodeoxyribonuclease VII small subunit [Staphylococcus gallinarum]MCD8825920.1 exodeoxyribonuclease VII small subunit [Staphylococcus gallinarum]